MLAYCLRRSAQDMPCDPVACEVDIANNVLHDLGGGYRAYLVTRPWPNVESCVIDSRTGAIFGGTLAAVKQQIRKCGLYDHDQRQQTAIRIRGQASVVSPEEFWPWIIQMLTENHI